MPEQPLNSPVYQGAKGGRRVVDGRASRRGVGVCGRCWVTPHARLHGAVPHTPNTDSVLWMLRCNELHIVNLIRLTVKIIRV